MKVLRLVALLLVGVFGFLYLLANYSHVETRLRCEAVSGTPGIIFANLELLRPWVFWASDDGQLWVETEAGFYYYFSELDGGEHYVQRALRRQGVPSGALPRGDIYNVGGPL